MIIDLIEKKSNKMGFNNGDILVFWNNEEYDFHQVVFDNHGATFRLLALEDSRVNEKWNSITDMIEDLNKVRNGFKLIEAISSNEVVLRRVAND